MSRENVDAVQASLHAWSQRRMDAFRDFHDANVVVRQFIEGWPEPDPVAGLDAVMDFYAELLLWQENTAEPISDPVDAGDSVVVRVLWRALAQGQEVGMEVSIVYTLRKGKIAMIEFFRDHAEALEAVGLSE
jgi:ketosteroid isomerase-like protein